LKRKYRKDFSVMVSPIGDFGGVHNFM